MKAAIYNPYLDTLGGGERYTMAVATALRERDYVVDVEWPPSIKEKLEKRFGIDLKGINFVEDVRRGDGYDICFWVSDGSVPTLKSRKNFLHFQVPFMNVGGGSLINKFKLLRINRVICNSEFTKKIIDKEFGVDSAVLYPPVSVNQFGPKKKENVILNVARFSSLMQYKQQDLLIKTFKNFYESNPSYRLILAGGTEVGADEYLKVLKREIKNFPIEIVESPDFKTLKILYSRAKFFWSASGFGVDEAKEPKKVEHFGITVVEAMASGAISIVFNGGGHTEIIENGVNGFLWDDTSELYRRTKELASDEKKRKKVSTQGIESAKKYSYEEFEKNFNKLI